MKHFSNISVSLLLQIILSLHVHGRSVAILYALDSEWDALIPENALLLDPFSISKGTVQRFQVNETTFYGMKLGAGPVTSAVTTSSFCFHVPVDLVLTVGPVGSLTPTLPIGSIVRVQEVIPWQTVSNLNQIGPDSITPLRPIPPPGNWQEFLSETPAVRVASGEAFIQSSPMRASLHFATGAQVVDMNLFGILAVLKDHRIPSIHFRIISDLADEKASEDFRKFRTEKGRVLGEMLRPLLEHLPKDPSNPDHYPELKKLFESGLP